MPSEQRSRCSQEAWKWLGVALRNDFYHPTVQQHYIIRGIGNLHRTGSPNGGYGYLDRSCAEYLLDDLAFALVEEECPAVELMLRGREDGPISESWHFTFDRLGLISARHYYNDD